ncbi:hypothetical protein [Aquibacillus sediminis]|uniref:hypothetical protein n=1 Tax=Aquibacillus sediminis TaxID=2574734 RepID=UPI001107FBCC|nr:hypothetical protein [Aquibacillus sediminis]
MINKQLIDQVEEKRIRYMISKQSLSKLIGINANFFRDILRKQKSLPKTYQQRVTDFIELPLDDYITKYQGVNTNVKK